jgi:hypothetical protein
LMWIQIFCVILLLGLAGLLDRSLVLAVHAGITCFLLGATWKKARASAGMREVLRQFAGEVFGGRVRDRLLMVLAGVCSVAVIWFTILNVAFPSGGYDDFVFHIPSAAYYVQQHSVSIVSVAPVQGAINTAAKLGEFFSVFQFCLLGNDRLIHFWIIPMLIHYILAIYALSRQLGATRSHALFGSMFSIFAPTLICQTLTAYNDLPMATLFANGLSFAVNEQRGRSQRLAMALASGLLLSSKLSAVLLCGIVLACFVIADLRSAFSNWLNALKAAIVIGTLASLLGGYWYVRNAAEYHNPFYPFEARIAGIHLPGPINTKAEMIMLNGELAALPLPVRLWRLWREEKSHFGLWLYNYDSAYAGFGPMFFILGVPSLVAALGISLLDRRWLTLCVLGLTGCAYLGFSGNISPRLSLFVVPAVGLGFATVLTAMERDWPWNRFGALRLGIKASACGLAIFTFLAVGAAPVGPQTLRAQLYTAPRDKDSIEGTFLNAFRQVREAIPRSAVVAYDEHTTFIWPLWRPDWMNEVRFIPSAAGWEHWRGDAATLRITHVVVGRPVPSPLTAWVEQHPDKFKLLAQGGFGALYAYRE